MMREVAVKFTLKIFELKSTLTQVTDENVTDLEKAGQQLGVLINQAVDKYMTDRGDRLVEQAAGIQLVQEFILQDKAGEICEQKWTQAAFSVVDKFYAEQTKEEVAKLLGVNLRKEEEENVVENDARTSGGEKEDEEEKVGSSAKHQLISKI
jgi:hypothetical protein